MARWQRTSRIGDGVPELKLELVSDNAHFLNRAAVGSGMMDKTLIAAGVLPDRIGAIVFCGGRACGTVAPLWSMSSRPGRRPARREFVVASRV